MHIQPYVFFDGRCDEAIAFYRAALGAEVKVLMRYKESPEPHPAGALPPGSEDKVMHASLRIGQTDVFASDGCNFTGRPEFEGFALSLTADGEADARRKFDALAADGGKVHMPLGESFFAFAFGMVADRFGVHWMVIVPKPM